MVVFGGTGGLGLKLVPLLMKKYDVISLGSKDVDITKLEEVENFFYKNQDVDIVLNLSGREYNIYLSKIDTENQHEIKSLLDINILGNINILAASLPYMIKNKSGRIISMSSILSNMNIPKASLYSASKAFVDRLMCSANKENIRYGVTCNSIQLGYWDGGMCERLEPKFKENILNVIGLKRWGSVKELYNTIDFIVENEYICGSNIKIDGGI